MCNAIELNKHCILNNLLMLSIVVQCIGMDKHSCAMSMDCITYDNLSCAMYWDCIANDKHNCAMHWDALLMISIIVQHYISY